MKNRNGLILFLLIGLMIAYPCASYAQNISLEGSAASKDFSLDEDSDVPIQKYDPWEKYNRWMFRFNDRLYRRVFTPVSHGYDKVVPHPIQKGINNFTQFLRTPIRLVNNLLQGKFKNSATELGRFAVNGTVGIVGIFDPADRQFGWHQKTEDFAQTLGHYRVGSGRYIVLPILGPSDPRDIVGMVVDAVTSPMTWIAINNTEVEKAYNVYRVVDNVNNYSYNVRDTYQRIMDGAIDEYSALQQVYLQNREKNIQK